MPHRQVVLTIPKRLRAYGLYRRRLLGEIARVAAHTVTAAIRALAGERDLAVGLVACRPTHGSRANGPPHRHLLVTDGGFRPDGTFVTWPAHDTARLTEAFRRAVLRLFVHLDLFDEDQAAGMLTWPRSGFRVHTAVWEDPLGSRRTIAPSHPDRPVLRAESRRAQGAARDHPRATSRADRGHPPVGEGHTAALLQQIFEVDPLACPTGHGAMRIVACITQASVTDQILTHLRIRAEHAAHARSTIAL